ncbi:MAG: hypothetical protein QM632_05690 [Micrococcaceae bacterium]
MTEYSSDYLNMLEYYFNNGPYEGWGLESRNFPKEILINGQWERYTPELEEKVKQSPLDVQYGHRLYELHHAKDDINKRKIFDMAMNIAAEAHYEQTDKVGLPYINHPARVVGHLQEENASDEVLAVGWLHDVVEDTDVSLEDLRQVGFPEEIIEAIDAISVRNKETRVEYYERVKANPIALQVKLADIKDNTDPARLAWLDEKTQARLKKKYTKALAVLTGNETVLDTKMQVDPHPFIYSKEEVEEINKLASEAIPEEEAKLYSYELPEETAEELEDTFEEDRHSILKMYMNENKEERDNG